MTDGFHRIAGIIIALIALVLVHSVDARASFTCAKIDEWQDNDPAIATLVEKYFKTKHAFVSKVDQRFYIVRPGSENCPDGGCLYHLVQVTDGAVQERFAFNSTGWILWRHSPVVIYIESLKDYVSTIAVQTSANIYIAIHWLKAGNDVVVEPWSGVSQPLCGQSGDSKSRP